MSKAHYEHTKKRRISENFTLYEAINSDSYPQSVVMPSADVVYHLAAFAGAVLEPIRLFAYEKTPVRVDSWYRNPRLNKDVGGVDDSVHQVYYRGALQGVAADITSAKLSMSEILSKIARADVLAKMPLLRKVIFYPARNFIHVNSDIAGIGEGAPEFLVSLTKGKYERISPDEARNISGTLRARFNYGG